MDKSIINYVQSKDIISDLQSIIEQSQKVAHSAVNVVLIQRNWLMGKRIFEEELNGKERAEYGAEVIKNVSRKLTDIYGKGYTKSNLYGFYQFFKEYPDIFQSLIGKSETLLTWTHYLTLLQMETNKCLHQNTNYIYLVKKS